MTLMEALDKCFSGAYIPHIYELIYRYAFDVKLAMSDYGGIPYDIYLRLTQEITYIRFDGYFQRHLVNGVPHRLDGPAITTIRGEEIYCLNDKRHRLDGPAIIEYIYKSNIHAQKIRYSYFICDKQYNLDDFNAEVERRMKSMQI